MSVRGFILFILSTLLLACVLISGFGFNSLYLLDSQSYTPYLEESGVYNHVQDIIPAATGQSVVLNNVTAKAIVNLVIEKAFDYLNGKTDTLNITVSLDSKEVRDLIKEQISHLPTCEAGVDPIRDRVACKPQGVNLDEAFDEFVKNQNLEEISTQSVDLAQYLDKDGALTQMRSTVVTYRKVVYLSIIVSLILITLILWIGWSGRTRGLRNIATPITLAGISMFSTIYFGNTFLTEFIKSHIPNSPTLSFSGLILSVVDGIYSKFLFTAIIIAVTGLILLTCSFIFVREDKKEV